MADDCEVYLRPLRVEDAATSYHWRNNPEVWKNTGSAPDRIVTIEMETAWIERALADSNTKRYAICLKDSDRYVGNAYLSDVHDGQAEEQIFIGDPQLWGKGIGTRARSILYDIALTMFGVRRVITNIRTRNIASLKSVLKLGFVEVARDAEWVRMEKLLER